MGKPSDKNDKTQLLSDSMVVEVKPSPPKTPVEDKNDRSVWKGLVVGADEFAPPTPVKSGGGRWIVLIVVLLAGAGAAAYFLWPRTAAVKILPDAAAAPVVATPVDSLPHDAAPPDAAIDAPADAAEVIDAGAPDAAAVDAGVRAPAKIPFKVPGKKKQRPVPPKGPVHRTH